MERKNRKLSIVKRYLLRAQNIVDQQGSDLDHNDHGDFSGIVDRYVIFFSRRQFLLIITVSG